MNNDRCIREFPLARLLHTPSAGSGDAAYRDWPGGDAGRVPSRGEVGPVPSVCEQSGITAKLRWSFIPVLAGLMFFSPVACTTGTASYTGLNPDEFMKHWLVLGPIPVAGEASPDEDTQKKAFADDLLRPAAGQSAVQAKAGARAVIGGKNYEWRLVESTSDIIDLKVARAPEEFSIAYAWAEIEMPEKRKGLLGIGSDDGVKAWL